MSPPPAASSASAGSGSGAAGVYDPYMHKKLRSKEARIIQLQGQILAKRREQSSLIHRQRESKNKHFTETRLKNWKTMYDIVKLPDASLRPPDKTNNIRTYSNMDKDMWDGGERGEVLRGWFLQNAPEVRLGEKIESYDAEKEGFLVRNEARRVEEPQVMRVDHNRYTLTNPRAYSVPDKAAGFPGEF